MEIKRLVEERKLVYETAVMFRGSRVYLDNIEAARGFARYLQSKGCFGFEDSVGLPVSDEATPWEVVE